MLMLRRFWISGSGLALLALLIAAPSWAKSPNAQCQGGRGLSPAAAAELGAAGLNQYVGEFTPVSSVDVGDGWVKHTFDPDGGNGPICIAGTPYSAFTRAGNPSKLLVLFQGGGACWQNFYFCNILAEDQEPPPPAAGIWDFANRDNPFADHSIVYLPYCDGSLHSGDSDVVDANFPFGPVRFHRGLRNQTAAMDLAAAVFPNAQQITLAGSEGGTGAVTFAPLLARFAFGNQARLTVLGDAPLFLPANLNEAVAVAARAADWQFGQFFPASCTDCDDMGQSLALVEWRLDNDCSVRDAVYNTDGNAVSRFFNNVPTQADYRNLLLTELGAVNVAHPDRFKRFIRSGDDSNTALQSPLFYSGTANGVPLHDWTRDFLVGKPSWVDLVEDFTPLP
jgi:hypothetical protein